MDTIRKRNSVLLFKLETNEGEDASPVAASDAVLVENPTLSYDPNIIETDEVSSSLTASAPIIGGMRAQFTCEVYLKGSGALGTAPEYGSMLKACGFAETILASSIPASAEAAASGTINSLTLGAGAAGTENLYRGMPLLLSGNPADGDTALITDYTAAKVASLATRYGSALDNNTNYQILTNVLYSPATNNIPSGTIYFYQDGLLYQLLGCRGSVELSMETGGAAKLQFTFSGLIESVSDAAIPTPTYDVSTKPIWRDGKMEVGGQTAGVAGLSISTNNQVTYPADPNQKEGFGVPIITERNMQGSIDPMQQLVATRNIFSQFRNQQEQTIGAILGSNEGNRVGITIPKARYTALSYGDREGLSTEEMNFSALGADAEMFISIF